MSNSEINAHLLAHTRTHTGGKPLQCQMCEKKLASKYSLNIHMRTHANEFAFQCARCLIGFDLEAEKNEHEKYCKCKVYQCNLCKYRTFYKQHFDGHMRTHTGERPFA